MLEVKRFSMKGRFEYERTIEKMPYCLENQYFKYCVNVIGKLADKITSLESLEFYFSKFYDNFATLMCMPPEMWRVIKMKRRADLIMYACIFIGLWHEEGDRLMSFYEYVFRIIVLKKLPGFRIGSIVEFIEEEEFEASDNYFGMDIANC
ncbi:hypothetical protein HZB05_02745 [Candidatus Wolfebacteria bacterium]|nr:hypothetical protein [Candidatus Wolfebacteria bacterium]